MLTRIACLTVLSFVLMLVTDRVAHAAAEAAWPFPSKPAKVMKIDDKENVGLFNDRVGLLTFTNQIEKFVPARKGRTHVLRVIREILGAQPAGRGTNIANALDYAMRVFRRRSVMFLISDFMASGWELALKRAARRHDLITFVVGDPREESVPSLGLVELEDAETGETLLLDTSDARTRKELKRRALERRDQRRRFFRTLGIDSLEVATDRPYDLPLVRFFETRARRYRA